MVRLSNRAEAVQPSATLATAAKARDLLAQGVDVLSFGAGEPDFPTPAFVCEAAKRALDEGQTGYAPVPGYRSLREAICRRSALDQSLAYEPSEVVVGVGAKQIIFNACQALLNPGDEAILLSPYWVSYPDMVRLAGGRPVVVPTLAEDGFQLDPERVISAITARTRLLILNSPSNPSGVVYEEAALQRLATALEDYPEVTIISDDIYGRLLYDGNEFKNLLNFLNLAPSLRDRCLVVNGVSKTYAMTGWRIGWGLGPRPLIAAILKIQGQSTSGATSFAQLGAKAALEGDQSEVELMRQAFERRRNLFHEGLSKIEGIGCVMPGGAFYLFPDIRALLGRRFAGHTIADSGAFCEALLEAEQVAAVPGAPFGTEGFVRLSFATSEEVIQQGLVRLQRFAAGLS